MLLHWLVVFWLVMFVNSSVFTSDELKFLEMNGIVHLTSSPSHLASNGLAKRTLQILKQCMRGCSIVQCRHYKYIRLSHIEIDVCQVYNSDHLFLYPSSNDTRTQLIWEKKFHYTKTFLMRKQSWNIFTQSSALLYNASKVPLWIKPIECCWGQSERYTRVYTNYAFPNLCKTFHWL